MELNDYQQKAMKTCMPTCDNFSYMFINLVGEVGELASKVAKAIRKDDASIGCKFYTAMSGDENKLFIKQDYREDIMKEAGDILWQLSGLCTVMGWDLEQIASMNLTKLASRQKRGVIDGNGDNR